MGDAKTLAGEDEGMTVTDYFELTQWGLLAYLVADSHLTNRIIKEQADLSMTITDKIKVLWERLK